MRGGVGSCRQVADKFADTGLTMNSISYKEFSQMSAGRQPKRGSIGENSLAQDLWQGRSAREFFLTNGGQLCADIADLPTIGTNQFLFQLDTVSALCRQPADSRRVAIKTGSDQGGPRPSKSIQKEVTR
jgi:hypothetical protein